MKTGIKKVDILRKSMLPILFGALVLTPILSYVYIKENNKAFIINKKYYKIETTKGLEKAELFVPSFKPITNVDTTKEWLKKSLVDIFTYDAINYNSKERKEEIKNYFDKNSFNSFWESDQTLIKEEINGGILRNSTIISYKPVLLGEAVTMKGEKMWKFYLEMFTSSDSKFLSAPINRKRQVVIYIKEINPIENIKGIGIYKIDIK